MSIVFNFRRVSISVGVGAFGRIDTVGNCGSGSAKEGRPWRGSVKLSQLLIYFSGTTRLKSTVCILGAL